MMAAIDAFPFDSQVQSYESDGTPIYDRATDSKGFRNLLKTYFTEGVFPKPSNALQVVENGTLGALVKKGSCMVGGVTILVNEDVKVTFDKADVQSRIDRVVMRVDDTLSVRSATIQVIKGTASSSPTPPQRVYNDTIKDIVLANVTIPANASTITTSNITDTRPDSSICGWVTGTITEIDYSVLFGQYQAQFFDWFDTIKNQLTTDQAGNLQLQIDDIKSKTDFIENENLLINGYFLNPINQKDSLTYTYNVNDNRTIDMWHIFKKSASDTPILQVKNTGITVSTADLTQKIPQDIYEAIKSGYYTLTIKLANGDVISRTYNDNLSAGDKVIIVVNQPNSTNLAYTVTVTRYIDSLRVNISSGDVSVPIEFIKLERGQKFTGIETFDKYKEKNRCMRYFWRLTENEMYKVPCQLTRNLYVDLIVNFPVPMLNQPSAKMIFSPSTVVNMQMGDGTTLVAKVDVQKDTQTSRYNAYITVTGSSAMQRNCFVGYCELMGGYIEFDGERW